MTDDLYISFSEIRQFMFSNLQEKLEVFFCKQLDSYNEHIVTIETVKIISEEAKYKFPDFPEKYIPKCKIKTISEEKTIEIAIQSYFNSDLSLIFLANVEIDGIPYDLYCRKSLHPGFDYEFIARYGHDPQMKQEGSKTAAAEYMMGMSTPLSIAFQFAIEEGYVT